MRFALQRLREATQILCRMQRTKARILHVDDHQDTRLIIAALLNDLGYGVMTAGSVTEALALSKEIHYDLFILDVTPGRDWNRTLPAIAGAAAGSSRSLLFSLWRGG